jgi:hypothetical protein
MFTEDIRVIAVAVHDWRAANVQRQFIVVNRHNHVVPADKEIAGCEIARQGTGL